MVGLGRSTERLPVSTRREFLAASTAAAAAACAAPIVVRSSGTKPRSVVLVITDDQRADAMGCAGHPILRTPNMDRLATEGAMCRNAFVTIALCSPSRATMLTGQYAHRHGVTDNGTLLPRDLPTYATILQAAGYDTAYVGKWHMGNATDEPQPGWGRWASFRGQGPYFNPTINLDGDKRKFEGYTTDVLTDLAVAWIRGRRDRPFCLVLGHKAPHALFEPAPRHRGLFADAPVPAPMPDTDAAYDDAPVWVRAQRRSQHGADGFYGGRVAWGDFLRDYLRTLVAVDESLGRILAALEERRLLDSTLVIHTSDNGFLFGEHGLIDKRCMFEESIRVPLLVRCPELIRPGARVDPMVLNLDLAPTVLDAAGLVAAPTMQGESFLPLLRGEPAPWRSAFLYEYFFERAYPETPTVLGVRTARWKYMEHHGVRDHDGLYDLETDPREEKNLARAPEWKAKREEMAAELGRLLERFGGRRNPSWAR